MSTTSSTFCSNLQNPIASRAPRVTLGFFRGRGSRAGRNLQGGSPMRQPRVDDFVRLRQDIPELSLWRGEVGVVRSSWFATAVAYEVECQRIGHDYQSRALLQPEQ